MARHELVLRFQVSRYPTQTGPASVEVECRPLRPLRETGVHYSCTCVKPVGYKIGRIRIRCEESSEGIGLTSLPRRRHASFR